MREPGQELCETMHHASVQGQNDFVADASLAINTKEGKAGLGKQNRKATQVPVRNSDLYGSHTVSSECLVFFQMKHLWS